MDIQIHIITYSSEHHAAFKELNFEWLDKHDLRDDPAIQLYEKNTGSGMPK